MKITSSTQHNNTYVVTHKPREWASLCCAQTQKTLQARTRAQTQ